MLHLLDSTNFHFPLLTLHYYENKKKVFFYLCYSKMYENLHNKQVEELTGISKSTLVREKRKRKAV